MNLEKAKGEYNFQEDIFVARSLRRDYDSSFQIGNLIFDLDSKNKVIGLEIVNASKLFGIPKLVLKNMVSGKIIVIASNKIIRTEITLESSLRNSQKTSSLSVERIKPEFINATELHLAVA